MSYCDKQTTGHKSANLICDSNDGTCTIVASLTKSLRKQGIGCYKEKTIAQTLAIAHDITLDIIRRFLVPLTLSEDDLISLLVLDFYSMFGFQMLPAGLNMWERLESIECYCRMPTS